ncbi:DJ-1/PfpI family protein [Rhodococcus sp. HM1]|uniref:DJ-1/PfpI family protein n=1 Tax=unclassified Rhodococcus (in: high G+C Gram-positive bacteria) TaxID=192944 RepID=UPI0018CD7236|nr:MULTISPECIES: DJ-1/PfpI family protein [unclassified Rhodococcus (in: high G+C Gram-positive bacteria)]MBH0119035.1 DJ-1/PfpI family protein [Rhodococcus sp. CX]MCK8673370.1 DJ-1/PfpI family protein [Rhodococcus sp. HM1]
MTPTLGTVFLAVYDTLADWEPGHAVAHLARAGYTIRAVGPSREPVTTMAGIRIVPDLALDEVSPDAAALLVLPGADLWDTGDELAPYARLAREFLDTGVPVAAICGATAGLAREGLLDDRDHTSNVSFYLAATGYGGAGRYVEADAVTDGILVTAGGTEPVAFAREIFGLLGVYEGEVLDAWYRLFHDSDASAFPILEAAEEAAGGDR